MGQRARLMVPSNEPEEVSVVWSATRSILKLPVASANRPVPSVMVAVSTMVTTPFKTVPRPVRLPEMLSLLAAMSVKDPVVVEGTPSWMSNSNVAVKRPKCVACPVPVRTECRTGVSPCGFQLLLTSHGTVTPNRALPPLVRPRRWGWTGRLVRSEHPQRTLPRGDRSREVVVALCQSFRWRTQ